MPKIKNHSGAKKRVFFTGTGKAKRRRAGQSHKRAKKSKNLKRSYRRAVNVSSSDRKRLKKLLPYR